MMTKETFQLPCSAEAAYQAAVKVFHTAYPIVKIDQEEYIPSLLTFSIIVTVKRVIKIPYCFFIHVTREDNTHCSFTISCQGGEDNRYSFVLNCVPQLVAFMNMLIKELGLEDAPQEL